MRAELYFSCDKPFYLPFNYNYPLQGFIYNALKLGDKNVAKRLHDNKKDVKFVFSKPLAEGRRRRGWWADKKGIFVKSRCFRIYFSTPEHWIFNAFIDGFFKLGEIRLFGKTLYLDRVRTLKEPEKLSGRHLKTLSPINVFMNNNPNGTKTWDLSPLQSKKSPFKNEPELWRKLLLRNLREKYFLLHGERYEGELDIALLEKPRPKQSRFEIKHVIKYNPEIKKHILGSVYVRGWDLGIELYGEDEILRVAYELGLGMRNSLGFGMVGVM